ncbi:MAG: hypothetical protein OSB00_20085 [Sphingomonas bacterium]|nr:hypothetical protein [Sphingomonas bacterium]
MRRLVFILALASAACAPSQPEANESAATNAVAANPQLRGAEPATSASAQAARALAVRYFDLIEQGDYAKARQLWGHEGADVGGDAAALGKVYSRFSRYEPVVGLPTEVHAADGRQYVNVAVKVRATLADTGRVLEQEGPVMMRRSADPSAKEPGEREWSIWGVDIRSKH